MFFAIFRAFGLVLSLLRLRGLYKTFLLARELLIYWVKSTFEYKKYQTPLKKKQINNKRIQDDFFSIFQKAPKRVLTPENHRGDQIGPCAPKIIDLQNENVFHIIRTLDQ